ncbi:hypothetical protein GN244_ATG06869 [Phytophthora infestans]|uniref:Uncharacterized protein n=1 Tax=Phytophthora infestans TaxID=4787 RepID=A0A833S575_PHYIN|nr:hypothetical protein GN244_ATG06869 [Phytophthora infestans]
MDPHTSPISLDNIDDLFNLPASMALLGEEDFEITMMMLDSSALRREDSDNLDMAELSDAFNSKDPGSPLAANEQHATSEGGNSCLSPDLKVRIGGRTPVGGAVYIKQESDMPGYSPVMDSFLRESWDDIVGHGSRSGQPSSCEPAAAQLPAPDSVASRGSSIPEEHALPHIIAATAPCDGAHGLQHVDFLFGVICFVYQVKKLQKS